MAAGNGLRSRIRDMLARPFRNSAGHEGMHHKFTRPHKIGDYVDIKVNGAVHEAMPQKFYHGRTGRVWKVTKRTIGVEINEQTSSIEALLDTARLKRNPFLTIEVKRGREEERVKWFGIAVPMEIPDRGVSARF